MAMRRERAGKGRTARTTKIKLLAAVALTVAPVVVDAADIQWGVQDGNWLDASNWVGGVLPAATDRALLDFVSTPLAVSHVTTDVGDIFTLTVKNGNTLSIEAGGDVQALTGNTVNSASNVDAIRIGDGSAGTVINVDGAFSLRG